ncbi:MULTISPECIES: dephospho-CoA kinase [Alphaproteobacteria]|uniref:Dephospho-CoA kinase n=3 Tax=Alphaproteobacteria TaxID=28211 RepID=A0A512HMB3_9HYPH|nr:MULTISPECIES: dephospho-CoA kinase [Alphaproteobacteria]GEO86591.1 dephospho-CoA kinase [Ciceribacter naphthalenivorans]GLR20837.1 dephospho-CoA kinase [Ciceribacter naphthalenivorans]GLT03693.1 dephospho-CoA kinase [Sphingomonas psychrolutea]
MIVLGLTGSIGMGKSTTASLFAEAGIPVNDADQMVHDLYRGEAVKEVGKLFPDAIRDEVVDRKLLAENLAKNPDKFRDLEEIVHPLVREREKHFLELQRIAGADMVVLDIPLLFETGNASRVDKIVVVSCDAAIQRQRVLERPGMTAEKFEMILSRQMPDAEKRLRADFVIDTGHGVDAARERVRQIIAELRAGKEKMPNA